MFDRRAVGASVAGAATGPLGGGVVGRTGADDLAALGCQRRVLVRPLIVAALIAGAAISLAPIAADYVPEAWARVVARFPRSTSWLGVGCCADARKARDQSNRTRPGNQRTMNRDVRLEQAADLTNVGSDLAASAAERFIYPRPALEDRVISLLGMPQAVPVLVGESGVGKTTLVQQVALRLATAVDDVPSALQGTRIIQVDPATLLSEALFANQLEHKVTTLSRNLAKGKAALFFDEIESFAGSGATSTDEDGDVLNLMLPFLKRGNGVRLLGSTTAAGWKRLAQLRPAFARHCVAIPVEPMSDDEVQQVLEGHARHIAQRAGFVVEPHALSTAIDLASALRPDARAPGGACELLQLALAHRRAEFARDRSATRITASGRARQRAGHDRTAALPAVAGRGAAARDDPGIPRRPDPRAAAGRRAARRSRAAHPAPAVRTRTAAGHVSLHRTVRRRQDARGAHARRAAARRPQRTGAVRHERVQPPDGQRAAVHRDAAAQPAHRHRTG